MARIKNKFLFLSIVAWLSLFSSAGLAQMRPSFSPKQVLDTTLQSAIQNAPNRSRWPDSHYVKLLDLGDLTIKPDGTTVGIYRETYKLFDRAARSLAEVQLPYNSSYQELSLLSARTIEPDGKVLSVQPHSVRQEGVAGDYLLYDDAMALGFSMPGIQDNCIIDYTYKVVTRPAFLPGQVSAYWGFNDLFPVMLSRFTLHAPAVLNTLQVKLHNTQGLQTSQTLSPDGRTKTWIWEMKDMPPIPAESSMPPINEVRAWLEISTIPNWQTIGRWFYKLYSPQCQLTPDILKKVEDLISGQTTEQGKASAIYRWVTDHVRYVGLEFGLSAYKPHASSEVFRNLYGDCKDKVVLLITMLHAAGIQAQPALLQAGRQEPLTDDLPILTVFNHCIAVANVGAKTVWLDPTAEDCPFGELPTADQGAQALVVDKNGGEISTIPITTPEAEGADFISTVTLGADGSVYVDAKAILEGETARNVQGTWRDLTEEKRKTFIAQIAQRIGFNGDVKTFSLVQPTQNSATLHLNFQLQSASVARNAGNLLLLPVFSGLLNQLSSPPYSTDKRVWPIVIEHPSHLSDIVAIQLPPNLRVLHLPTNIHLEGPLETYEREVNLSANGLQVVITDRFIQKKGTVPQSNYPKEQHFWKELLTALQDTIVIQKP